MIMLPKKPVLGYRFGFLFLFVLIVGTFHRVEGAPHKTPTDRSPFEWRQLPSIPDAVGLAGPYAGVHKNALLVGGGANFPDGFPWEGGTKVWHDQLFVLEEGSEEWRTGFSLPRPLGYGVSLTTERGVLCIGGDDADRMYRDVFLLRWTGDEVEMEELPSLPHPLAYSSGAILNNVVYVAGGLRQSERNAAVALSVFWSLDLSDSHAEWREQPTWPGPGRFLATASAQDGAFYLMGGARLVPNGDIGSKREYLVDGYRFKPGEGWRKIADMPRPAVAAPTPAPTVGRSHFLVIGGDDGSRVGVGPVSAHPGFPRGILSYHTVTDTWSEVGEVSFAPPVTVPVVPWGDGWVLPSGEVRPGVRTAEIWSANPVPRQSGFGAANYTTLGLYLLVLVAMALYFSKGQTDTDEFFLGGRKLPWWAVGLSIFGTQLSAITFIAIPARVYATDWTFILANATIVLVAPMIVYGYLPFYRRLNITTIYEYLEQRFNLAVRLFGSVAFILLQLGRMGIVLFIPALALATVTGVDIIFSILAMGVLATLYTAIGGIKAVIWTDVLQVVVLMGGAILCLFVIFGRLPEGFGTFLEIGARDGKFNTFNWSWNAATTAVWVVVLGNLFANLIPYSADQTVAQRYLTTADEKKAARSIWTNAILTIPASLIFFGLGTAIYVFYKVNPGQQSPELSADAIFPLFIAEQLPAGVAGLLIAGIFAAAMSSLDSSMNSVATTLTTDYRRLSRRAITDAQSLSLAKILTAVLGVFGTATALLLATADVGFLWDTYSKVLGLFGGSMAGLFALAVFTRRANGAGALVGALASAVIVYLAQRFTPLHFFLYAGVGIVSCFVIGYLASLLFPGSRKEIRNLTIFTIDKGSFHERSTERSLAPVRSD